MGRAYTNEPDAPQGAREWTQSTLRPPARNRTHPNEAEDSKGAQEWAESEPDDTQGAWEATERTRMNTTISKAHGNGESTRQTQDPREWNERTLRHTGRT